MNKKIIKIPRGIEYISQWEEYTIPKGEHCIVDKGVTGCGYTEFTLRNDDWVVLCSPRRLLLENKSEKHMKEGRINVLYLDSLSSDDILDRVNIHLIRCYENNLPPKLLITYDSTGKLISCLKHLGVLNKFTFIVDEFQSIFLDSYFKVGIEFDFVNNLQDCDNVIYLSATPMLDKYLEMIDEFKDLDFYKLDWSDTGYVETIYIRRKRTNALTTECCKIVNQYLKEDYPLVTNSDNIVYQSKEAVFYFNSVSEILRVIRKCGLTPENTSIICSKTDKNEQKLKKEGFTFGRVPLEGERNPTFTFCTSAVYIGVDFYSDCASSYVFADPNIECLALDISLDLPQIIGRQRNKNNPFKNYIVLFYKTKRKDELELNEENFKRYQERKRRSTKNLLEGFERLTDEQQKEYVIKLTESIEYSNYSRDFVSIAEKTGSPVYNTLIDIADQRAWDVSQKDYQDSLSVTKAIQDLENLDAVNGEYCDNDEKTLRSFLHEFYKYGDFRIRMEMYCKFSDEHKDNPFIMEGLQNRVKDPRFLQYYRYYGTNGCANRNYQNSRLKMEWEDISKEDKLAKSIYSNFSVGDKMSLNEIKLRIKDIYTSLGINKSPKASDIKEFFSVSRANVKTKDGISNGLKLKDRLK